MSNYQNDQQLITSVASLLHDAWRSPRLRHDGTYDPRIKDDGFGGKVDIANTSYTDLPAVWQEENRLAAIPALAAFDALIDRLDPHQPTPGLETTKDHEIFMATRIHNDWCERHKNEEWCAQLMVPYHKLSHDEQEKDIAVARVAMREIKL